ncbi:hypothetical protein [Bartonella harrusi]|uniref:Uncharacterized protein n=1 Tax=Bartonella harrusi TaxID=2961895 RepID=A0ABY5ERV7_9HYPH|nr:hypothetical protein [Bartonella harrusi]UTO28124.1 hypothetical protein NMK50_07995 [Bartonella harrusi]
MMFESARVKVCADERLRGGVGNDGCMLATREDGGNKPFCVLRLCR